MHSFLFWWELFKLQFIRIPIFLHVWWCDTNCWYHTDNKKTHNTPSIMRFSKTNQLANVVNLNSTSKVSLRTRKFEMLWNLIAHKWNLIKVFPQFDNEPKHLHDIANNKLWTWTFPKWLNNKRQFWFAMVRKNWIIFVVLSIKYY